MPGARTTTSGPNAHRLREPGAPAQSQRFPSKTGVGSDGTSLAHRIGRQCSLFRKIAKR